MGSVDRVLDGAEYEYETWASRNRIRSLSTVRGRSEGTIGPEELNGAGRVDSHLARLRYVLKPDEAFGAIFTWDTVMRNARELELAAWVRVAEEEGLQMPDMEDVIRAEMMAPEAAVTRCFFWNADWGEVKRLVFRKSEIYEEMQAGWVYTLTDGVVEWLAALKRYGVKSVLCAPRGLKLVLETMRQVGLGDVFTTAADVVTIDDEYESLEQMYLMASIKLERPPDKCVVFTDKPEGITAGREVSARVIALIGAHPAYEIKSADKTIPSFEGMVVYHVRSLFSQQGLELMDPETELEVQVDR
jgi:5-amino-6-(5-phospho-D-ribitylamino)uracil phosphatase